MLHYNQSMLTSFFIILAACAVYGLVHSLFASLSAKARAGSWLGNSAQRYYRLFFNIQSVVTILPVLYLSARLPDAPLYTISLPWLTLTLALQFAGAVGLLVGVMQTGLFSFLGLDALRPGWQPRPAVFVSGGLYRWVRHPLYTCGLLVLWLAPVMTWNTLSFSLGLTAYILVGIYYEERKLLREFGPDYADYQQRTPMLIPLVSAKRTSFKK